MTNVEITRRTAIGLLGGAGLAAVAPVSTAWANSGGASMTFLAVGDWGREGNFHQRDVAARMAESADQLKPRFIISVGDNFYEDGVDSVDDPAWQRSFESVYDAPSLRLPWRAALGNHDYHGNTQAQIDYGLTSSRWRLPARWYSYEERTPDDALVEFFVIDTSPMIAEYYEDGAVKVKVADQKRNVPVQLAWLDAGLVKSRADWKIVVGHHPVYSGKAPIDPLPADDDAIERKVGGSPDLITMIDPILKRHRVPLYLNGHDHDLQHIERGATHYVCTGAGSETAKHCNLGGSDFCSLRSGFVVGAVNRDRMRIAYRDYEGKELHVVDIARPV